MRKAPQTPTAVISYSVKVKLPPGYAPDFRNELEKSHLRVAIYSVYNFFVVVYNHVIPSILENVDCVSVSYLAVRYWPLP